MKYGCLAFLIGFRKGFGLKKKMHGGWKSGKCSLILLWILMSPLWISTQMYARRGLECFMSFFTLPHNWKMSVWMWTTSISLWPCPRNLLMCLNDNLVCLTSLGMTLRRLFKGSLRPSETLAETPLVEIREIYASHVGQGVLDRSRGLSRKCVGAGLEKD